MRVTIHQPEHMPWVGFFHKMAQADIYVLLDDVQFKKNNWQNRNRIVSRAGEPQWLSVPVLLKDHLQSTIRDIRIDNEQPWQRKYFGRIHDAYCRHPFYESFAGRLQEIVFGKQELLAELNNALIGFFREVLGLGNRLVWSSDLGVPGKSTERLVNICRALGASTYIAGPDGRAYLDAQQFADAGIALEFHAFKPPVYPAPHFHPGMSCLDLIMNQGPQSPQVLGIA